MNYICNLEELRSKDLIHVGGKASNLGELIHAGFFVPSGICITTKSYFYFISENHIEDKIYLLLKQLIPDDNLSFEKISGQIRDLFERSDIPDDLYEEIIHSYKMIKPISTTWQVDASVAVRSSATVEDLPELSFAGQQDTYLNISGVEELIKSIKKCWSSLWSARAIQYRIKNKVDQSQIALAIIIQNMVPSEASGVMFTANPFDGSLHETVIESTLGLCESLVSGQINPDYFIVDMNTNNIIEKTINTKKNFIQSKTPESVKDETEIIENIQSISDEVVFNLSKIGEKIALHFQTPQDIEWAYSNGLIYIIQSRPITVKLNNKISL